MNLLDSEFGILGSGLFSSDAPHTDPFRMGTKKKSRLVKSMAANRHSPYLRLA